MTVQIHPTEKSKEYTDLLLALLAQANLAAMAGELLPMEDKAARAG